MQYLSHLCGSSFLIIFSIILLHSLLCLYGGFAPRLILMHPAHSSEWPYRAKSLARNFMCLLLSSSFSSSVGGSSSSLDSGDASHSLQTRRAFSSCPTSTSVNSCRSSARSSSATFSVESISSARNTSPRCAKPCAASTSGSGDGTRRLEFLKFRLRAFAMSAMTAGEAPRQTRRLRATRK